MSGVFGLHTLAGDINFNALKLHLNEQGQQATGPKEIEFIARNKCLLGRAHHNAFHQPDIASAAADAPTVITAGYSIEDGHTNLGWSRDSTQAVGRILETGSFGELANLNGTFQCVHISAHDFALSLISDRFGLMPLFIFARPGLFAFAPDLSLLLTLIRGSKKSANFSPRLNREAVAEWLEVGLVMGKRTLLDDITIMPAGSVLTWTGERGAVRRYWSPVFSEDNGCHEPHDLSQALDTAVHQSLRRRITGQKQVSVSLSGGLDSRLLLAASVREALPVSSITFGPARSSDHLIAAEVAERLGVTHAPYYDVAQASVEMFDLGIRRSAGMSNVLDLWGLQHGPPIRDHTDILINGIGGNELFGFLAFDLLRFQKPRDLDYLTTWLLRKLSPGWRSDELHEIWDALSVQPGAVEAHVREFWNRCPAKTPMGRIYHFYLEEKSRRANALGVATDDLFLEPMAPFFDKDVVDLALQIPPRQRLLARFYREFLTSYYPTMSKIRYNRTGLPADVSTTRLLFSKLLSRLGRRRRDPAHPWDQWLRDELRLDVSERLLGSESHLRDVLPEAFVRKQWEAFTESDSIPASTIGQLLSLESFLRQFRPLLT